MAVAKFLLLGARFRQHLRSDASILHAHQAQLRAEKARNKAGESAVKEARQRLLALQDAGVPSSARCGSPGTLERHQVALI